MASAEEIAPGLHRWTAWHEEWREDVGAVAVETGDGLVLIDPLTPPAGLPVADHVLLTVYWHGRAAATAGSASDLGVGPFAEASATPRDSGDRCVPRR
jgi:hypothetical protein